MTGLVSLGLAGSLGPDLIAAVAPRVEEAGFHALWVNDTPDGDSLAALAAAAAVTRRLVLATGVIPLDRRPAAEIADAVASFDLPTDRLVIGVGSGGIRDGALRTMREGARLLRASTTASVVVGALGPKMRRLAVTEGDGVLLNWLTPDAAAAQREELGGDARVSLYVRTALDAAARGKLEAEAARYAGFPTYAANFARLGIDVSETVLGDAAAFDDRLPAYRAAVDEVVLRAITPSDSVDDLTAFIERAAVGVAA